jgi:hypothetical protein
MNQPTVSRSKQKSNRNRMEKRGEDEKYIVLATNCSHISRVASHRLRSIEYLKICIQKSETLISMVINILAGC